MKYLITTTEVYRASSEEEASQLIEDAKKESSKYTLTKYGSQYKEKKVKGTVEDYWWKVTLVKEFTSEKEPDRDVTVSYGEESAF